MVQRTLEQIACGHERILSAGHLQNRPQVGGGGRSAASEKHMALRTVGLQTSPSILVVPRAGVRDMWPPEAMVRGERTSDERPCLSLHYPKRRRCPACPGAGDRGRVPRLQ